MEAFVANFVPNSALPTPTPSRVFADSLAATTYLCRLLFDWIIELLRNCVSLRMKREFAADRLGVTITTSSTPTTTTTNSMSIDTTTTSTTSTRLAMMCDDASEALADDDLEDPRVTAMYIYIYI